MTNDFIQTSSPQYEDSPQYRNSFDYQNSPQCPNSPNSPESAQYSTQSPFGNMGICNNSFVQGDMSNVCNYSYNAQAKATSDKSNYNNSGIDSLTNKSTSDFNQQLEFLNSPKYASSPGNVGNYPNDYIPVFSPGSDAGSIFDQSDTSIYLNNSQVIYQCIFVLLNRLFP